MKRILCTGAGGPAGINFITSLRLAPEKMFIVGTEANEHYLHLATTEKKYKVPRAHNASYIDTLNDIIEKEKNRVPPRTTRRRSRSRLRESGEDSCQRIPALESRCKSLPGQTGLSEDMATKKHPRSQNHRDSRRSRHQQSIRRVRGTNLDKSQNRRRRQRQHASRQQRNRPILDSILESTKSHMGLHRPRTPTRQKHRIPQPLEKRRTSGLNGARAHRVHLPIPGTIRHHGNPVGPANRPRQNSEQDRD